MFQRFLDAGIAIAGVDAGESYGSPTGRRIYASLYAELVEKRGLSKRPVLLARSRGGLMLYGWAAEHPESVAGIAGIYPVCNLRSYPGLAKACGAFRMTEAQLAKSLRKHNPIDRLAPLAKAGVPIFHIHGDRDRVVPLSDNSGELHRRYRKLGGTMTLRTVEGQGHNMWPRLVRVAGTRRLRARACARNEARRRADAAEDAGKEGQEEKEEGLQVRHPLRCDSTRAGPDATRGAEVVSTPRGLRDRARCERTEHPEPGRTPLRRRRSHVGRRDARLHAQRPRRRRKAADRPDLHPERRGWRRLLRGLEGLPRQPCPAPRDRVLQEGHSLRRTPQAALHRKRRRPCRHEDGDRRSLHEERERRASRKRTPARPRQLDLQRQVRRALPRDRRQVGQRAHGVPRAVGHVAERLRPSLLQPELVRNEG